MLYICQIKIEIEKAEAQLEEDEDVCQLFHRHFDVDFNLVVANHAGDGEPTL